MTQPEKNDELSDRVITIFKSMGNLAWESLRYPFRLALLDRTTGRILPYVQEKAVEVPLRYNVLNSIKFSYILLKESIFHPFQTSYINRDTWEITRENRKQ